MAQILKTIISCLSATIKKVSGGDGDYDDSAFDDDSGGMTDHERRIKNIQCNSDWTAEYADICEQRPAEYSYYGKLEISWGNITDYECYHKLGRGKYSEVFLGCSRNNNRKCIVKVLKPIKVEKIYREVKILQTLYGGPYIIKLFDMIRDPTSKTCCFVFE